MKKILRTCLRLFRNQRFQYSVISITLIAITAVHIIMYNRYHGTTKEPSWEFTMIVHIGIIIATIAAIIVYKKYVKPMIEKYDKD